MTYNNSPKGIEKLFDLHGKVALITGASGALGQAVSIGLAAYGAEIVICDLETESLKGTAERIKERGQKVLALQCDVTDQNSVDSLIKKAINDFGEINILFNSAGIALRQPAIEMPIEDWQKVMDVNVKGTLLCCRAVANVMIEQKKPCAMINVGSVRGFRADDRTGPAYGTSKATVHYLTKQLASEWSKNDIRVNCIAPCIFWSSLTEPLLSDEEKYKDTVSNIPLGRAAVPEDFIGATVFLASEASAMVTGHVLSVDGGILML